MTISKVQIAVLLLGLVSCSALTSPGGDVTFNKSTYLVTLSADASRILSVDTPVVTVSGAAVAPFIGVNLAPSGTCSGVGGGVYFPFSNIMGAPASGQSSAKVVTPFNVCSTTVLTRNYPRGDTQITARVIANDKTYSATATVHVQ